MPVAFTVGEELGRNDLKIFLVDELGVPCNAAEISFALYFVDKSMGPPGIEVLIGPAERIPQNPAIGEYYAAIMVPPGASPGDYRIRWTFRKSLGDDEQMVTQEFGVVSPTGCTDGQYLFSTCEQNLIDKLRVVLRDNNPDRNYHFRPPEQEGVVKRYNKVFGYIWEDYELLCYLQLGLAWINAAPPETESIRTLNDLCARKPVWVTWVMWAAAVQALFALSLNWIADEFSVAGETLVRVQLPGEEEHILPIAELFSICKENPEPGVIYEAYVSGALKVQAVDPLTGEISSHVVSDIMRHDVPHKRAFCVVLENGVSVIATEDHSLFLKTSEEIKEVLTGEIKVGDEVAVVVDGEVLGALVSAVTEEPPRQFMYDLSVPGPENFVLANGILAHNSYSIGGISLDLEKSSKYESLKQNAEGQLDKATDFKARTVKFIRGLQQPKFGFGVRYSFGPQVGRGILSPRSFV